MLAAKAPGLEFAAMFQQQHAATLVKLCQPSQPDDIRASAIGEAPQAICL